MAAKARSSATAAWTQHLRGLAGRLDLARLLPLAGATLLLAFAAFAAWQACLIQREASVRDGLLQVRSRAAESVESVVQAARAQLTQALRDPTLASDLAAGDAAARGTAALRLKALLPDALTVEVFEPALKDVLGADFRRFGYAKAAQLVRAQASGMAAPIEVRGIGPGRVLSLVDPIDSGGRVIGYAWVALPFAPLANRFASVEIPGGRLELRQGDGRGDLVILSRGGNSVPGAADVGMPVPGSLLRVAALPPEYYIVLTHSLAVALALLLLALAGAGALLWLRARRAAAASMHHPEEPTLADVLRTTVAAPVAAAADPLAAPVAPKPAAPAVAVERSIFRAYDIRGVVGRTLTAEVARLIGQAIGSRMGELKLREVVVGRDGRHSGPELSAALADGLRAAGIDVIDIGAVPTPVVYFATYLLNTGSGVAVTGSHNPPDYNGFKIVVGGETLSEDAIQDLYARIAEGRLTEGRAGSMRSLDVLPDYIERITSELQAERKLKIVVDCGNGIAGAVAPQVLEGIGGEVIPLYCDVDGNFPNHHPDPSDPHNLADLILSVKRMGADLGLAFDGDGDRLGVVTRDGEIIYPDRLLMLFAMDVLTRDPGATIIYDVKCTGHLQSLILKHGGSPLMWRTGHSLIKAKMRETEAALAGEMSGHFFFRERWYGFDDGIYAAARLLEILAGDLQGRSPEEIFATLPKSVSTPELKVELAEGEHYRFMDKLRQQASFADAALITIDGVRADWPDGWGLVRASNTTPVLVLRFEADNAPALKRIQQVFRQQLLAVDAKLKLPF